MPTYTYTLTNSGTGAPVADALIQASSDAGGASVVTDGRTSAAGVVVLTLAAGAYYIHKIKAGFTASAHTLTMAALALTGAGTMTAVSGSDVITAADVLGRVRALLRDDQGADYWSDAVLIGFLADAQRDICSRAPRARFNGVSLAAPVDPAAAGDSLTIGRDWLARAAAYVCGRALAIDGDRARSQAFMEEYERGIDL